MRLARMPTPLREDDVDDVTKQTCVVCKGNPDPYNRDNGRSYSIGVGCRACNDKGTMTHEERVAWARKADAECQSGVRRRDGVV